MDKSMYSMRVIIALTVIISLSGCMTIATQFENCNTLKSEGIPIVYSGAYEDIHKLILFSVTCHGEGCFAMPSYPLLLIGGIVDLPLSFIADTITLPRTIPLSNSKNCEDNNHE